MGLGPFLRRGMNAASRREQTYYNRLGSAALAVALIAASFAYWDWQGWDRTSAAGVANFVRTAFWLVVSMQVLVALGTVAGEVAPAIARERDRKSLDALLASRLSSAEIVLGTTLEGLIRYATSLAAVLPVVLLMVSIGGVDPRLVLLAGAGLISTSLTLAAIAIAASVAGRTARHALSWAVMLGMTWMYLPVLVVMVLPLIWRAATPWVRPVGLILLDSSPSGMALNLAGMVRRAPPLEALLWMIGLQAAGTILLVGWAIARLRPASRALHDGEGRAAFLRSRWTRRRRRPPCGDDPVLWNEIYSTRGMTPGRRLAERACNLALVALLIYVTSWFARPAFVELYERGYGAEPVATGLPDLDPFARAIASNLGTLPIPPNPGQSRLEFNIVLRQGSVLLIFCWMLVVGGAAAESVTSERERDTWIGLVATPLTGREILRAKILGSIWRMRGVLFVIVGLWTVGLATGAVHPLGYLAALAGLAASSWFVAALGVYCSLTALVTARAVERTMVPTVVLCLSGLALPLLAGWGASVWMAAGSPPFLAWAALLSYDDVRDALTSGVFPQLEASTMRTGEGAATVLAACLVGTAAFAIGGTWIARAAYRKFDTAVGRPSPPREHAPIARPHASPASRPVRQGVVEGQPVGAPDDVLPMA